MQGKYLIPIVGIHSSGKSTVRRELEKLGYVTEEECAEIIRKKSNVKAGASADISFEHLVQEAEMERDHNRVWNSDMVLVESWHILTVAYILTRGASIDDFEGYIDYIREQKNQYSIHCIFLQSDHLKILERSRKLHSEDDIEQYYDFYKALGENILLVLQQLGFDYKKFNTMKPIEETVEEIDRYLTEVREK